MPTPLHPNPLRVLAAATAMPRVMPLPVVGYRADLGFPSPAEDYMADDLDLSERCIRNPLATYFVEATGRSMEGFGIYSGDTLIVDRSITPQHLDLVMVNWEGGYCIKQLCMKGNTFQLRSGNPEFSTIDVPPDVELEVWGVVTWSFRKQFRRSGS